MIVTAALPRGSVIIPTWNARDALARCLDSLQRQEFPGGLEVIVIDNASTDGTVEMCRSRPVQVIANDTNVGFGAASNQGAESARGEILFLLNADTELCEPNTLARLADALALPGVGLVGPKLLNPDRTLQRSCNSHPTVANSLVLAAGLHRVIGDEARRRHLPQFWSHDRSIDTGWLLGAALAIRTDLYRELGGCWPTHYGEDEDLAYRVQQRGLRVRFESSASAMHIGNYSGSSMYSQETRAARVANAELTFLRTHYRPARASAIRVIRWAGYAARVPLHRAAGDTEASGIFRAMAKVLRPTPGPRAEAS